MTLGNEAFVILGIISVMMLADFTYVGGQQRARAPFSRASAAAARTTSRGSAMATIIAPFAPAEGALHWHFGDSHGLAVRAALSGLGTSTLVVLAHAASGRTRPLVLIFLNLLPYTKHFHIITAIPNVFPRGTTSPRGRLRPLAPTTEALMAAVEKATEGEDLLSARIGYARIEHFTWKDMLDFYTCTECGRCSDNCPAFTTGKLLSPKQFTLDLRNHLYARQEVVSPRCAARPCTASEHPAPRRALCPKPRPRQPAAAAAAARNGRDRAEGVQTARSGARRDSRGRAVGLHHVPRV